MSQVLRDKNGRKLGEIRGDQGRLLVYDKNGKRKGEYDPKTNTTKDKQGKPIGEGNLLVSLL